MNKILITGCSSGFGYDATKYLAEKGHHIYATMRNVSSKMPQLQPNSKPLLIPGT
jgi:short-subunit dehydrogenase